MSALPFETMNETDVREAILRPLLHDLGWKLGTTANIRTEITLSYRKRFLGHAKDTDPDLVGRADYICDLVGVARWIVEAKAPSHPLTQYDVNQAHSYASHPEVNATYFLLCNGREFRLYQTSYIVEPILAFPHHDLPMQWTELLKVLSPAALMNRHASPFSPRAKLEKDPGSALAPGWAPQARVMGGWLLFKGVVEADASKMSILSQAIGRRGTIVGEYAYRTLQSHIRLDLQVVHATTAIDELSNLMGLSQYSLECADPTVSDDVLHPTIFTGQIKGIIPETADLSGIPGVPQGARLPWPISFVIDARAVGFLNNHTLKGTFEYQVYYDVDLRLVPEPMHEMLGRHVALAKHSLWGEFEVQLMNIPRSALPAALGVLAQS